ncbi:MAG: SurA N-terminal domain-containing protein [Steroidobacteraceae bacterium]
MMQAIRDKISGWVAKVLLAALAIVFVFWGVELGSVGSVANSAAEVNGDSIGLTTLQNAWQQRQNELQQTFKGEIPEVIKKQAQSSLLNQLIRSQLVQQRVTELGFKVSDDDIAQAIRSLDSLKVDGQFSRDRYATALLQQGMNEAQFEAQFRTELATRQLQNGILGTAFITPKELARAQALLQEQRAIDYVVVPAKAYEAGIKVSDADLAAWYEANKASYLTPETVSLQYVELSLADSAAEVMVDDATLRAHYEQIKDRFTTVERRHGRHILIAIDKETADAAAKKQAEELLVKLKAGADFTELAKQYSKDTGSASNGGDLGWAGRGQFVQPFEEALFSLKPGELSVPVKSEFGYHLIRLDEIEGGTTKPFEAARAEVESDYRSERASSLFYDKTQKLADAAFASLTGLDSVAAEFGTTVKSIAGFTRQGGGEFSGVSQVIEAAFSAAVLERGENSPLITIGEDRALVLRVTDHVLPAQKSLESVRTEVVAKLTERAAKSAVAQQVQAVMQQLKTGALQWLALNKSLPVAPVGRQLLGRSAEGVPPQLLKAAFAISKADVVDDKPAYRSLALGNGDQALLMVAAVQSGSAATDEAAKARLSALRTQRINGIANTEFSAYIKELQRTADIEINPAAFE